MPTLPIARSPRAQASADAGWTQRKEWQALLEFTFGSNAEPDAASFPGEVAHYAEELRAAAPETVAPAAFYKWLRSSFVQCCSGRVRRLA